MKNSEQNRSTMISVRFNPVELQKLDTIRGSITRPAYLRELVYREYDQANKSEIQK